MPTMKRNKTKYPGVYFINGSAIGSLKPERIYYIIYRKNERLIEEKAGRQFQDDMTPAKASQIRTKRIQKEQLSNKEQRTAIQAEKESDKNRWTINSLWKEYKKGKHDLKGITQDENRFVKHIEPSFGDKEPGELFPLDIDRLRVKLQKTKSPGTVKNVLELLRRIVHYGEKKNLCQRLNFTIEMPRVNNIKTEDLTPKQLKSLLESIDKDPDIQAANFMKMVLFTGMRRGELFRLKWSDIDFEKGFIHLRDPKGGPDQTIPLNDSAHQLLKIHPGSKSEFVFPGRKGKQRVDIKRHVNRIKDKAGLPKNFRALHGLRHVYASMLASSGQVDMYTLQKLLTHKSPLMTQRYAHLRDETLKRASNLAGSIIQESIDDNKSISTPDQPGLEEDNK
ncbi:MAG: site-specific integrase [Desulfobacterales bacterium]